MPQSTDSERLGNNNGSQENTWISLGRGNRDFVSRFWIGGDRNMSGQFGDRVEWVSTEGDS